MVRSSYFATWLLIAASLTTLAAGCNSAPKNPAAALQKSQTAPAVSTAVAGSPDFSSSNKLKDPVKVHLAYALWHEQEGNLVEARNSYDKVLSENSRNVEAMLGLSRLDIALGRFDDAEHRLTKARKIAPKNPQVAISMGQFYSARSDWPRALEQMQLARSLSPYDPACAYHLGHVQAKCGDLTSALASFTEAVGAAEAEYNLAFMLHEQGDLSAAEAHLQRSISLKPELAQAQSLLLTVQQQRGGNSSQLAESGSRRASLPSRVVQPASYSEPAPVSRPHVSSFDPAPAR
ncbi:MAG: tetratricopeptide repeat protein [Planctomycetes bacterium]|nr:tetratricopeptide repeat protein [Planctomycetota bacterium]